MLRASARGQRAWGMAAPRGCDDQTGRHAIQAFHPRGLATLPRGSSAPPRTPHARFDALRREPRQTRLHQRPRTFGRPTRVWTWPRAAEVAVAEGMTPRPVRGAAMRQALVTLTTRGNRATHGRTSPDPA
jgi:hypothetical protein